MSETMTGERLDLNAIARHVRQADDMIDALNDGKREWLMSIPARPDHDPDLVIAAALRDTDALLAECRRLRALVEEMERRITADTARMDYLANDREVLRYLYDCFSPHFRALVDWSIANDALDRRALGGAP